MLGLLDTLRQIQGDGLGRLGFGPTECHYRIVATGARWRLRAYFCATAGPPLLIVAAPIKRPYIWDLDDSVSVVRRCLQNRLRLYLLEWMPPSRGDQDAGLADYTTQSIGEAVATVARQAGGKIPFIMGHSLGGTLAAIFAAFDPSSVRGLVLLSTPLCFAPGSCRFRDVIIAMAPPTPSAIEVVPGSLLSQLSVMASPETFLWSRLVDAALSMGDRRALALHVRVERWALDEFPLPGRLVHEILEWLYRDNRFCADHITETAATRRKAKRRGQEHETPDAWWVEGCENRRQCPAKGMPHYKRYLSTCLPRHCRDRLANRLRRIIGEARIFISA
ncbi:MAG TPA: alpha/beta fold hydrolase [Stellaceae bacterium]|nr:alpha/beta fold hydrolase [Stellaceae bacterium]